MTRSSSAYARALLCAVAAGALLAAAQLVGPGGMTTYGGGGRQRSYGRVRDPGKGFFVTGSTLWGVNGVYERVNSLHSSLMEKHGFSLAYTNKITGWTMGLADGPDEATTGYRAYGDLKTEWLFVDEDFKDRFGHPGETIIPGSGERWGHLDSRWGGAMEPGAPGRSSPGGGASVGPDGEPAAYSTEVLSSDAYAEWHAARRDQLPWQVIMIGDGDMLANLGRHAQYREQRAREAQRRNRDADDPRKHAGRIPGSGLPAAVFPPPELGSRPDLLAEALGGGEAAALAGAAGECAAVSEAMENAATSGEWLACAALFADAIAAYDAAGGGGEGKGLAGQAARAARLFGGVQGGAGALRQWGGALLHLGRAKALRKGRDPRQALQAVGGALALFPRFSEALHAAALARLDMGDYDAAKALWEVRLVDDCAAWLLRMVVLPGFFSCVFQYSMCVWCVVWFA